MESRESKSKEDGKHTKRNPSDPIYSMIPSKTQLGSRPTVGRRGAAGNACYVERQSFEL